MEVLTLDIGKGTQDLLYYIEGKNLRNCPKAVFPSPTEIVAKRIRRIASQGKDILLTGYTMGGGPSSRAIIDAASKVNVYSYLKPALTVNDNIEVVTSYGIQIVDEDVEAEKVELRDVDMRAYERILSNFDLKIPEKIVIAVQDHGYSPTESNRRFRFKLFEKRLRKSPYLENFLFRGKDVPECYNRMRSVVESVLDYLEIDVYVIDTVFAAIAGAMLDAKAFPALVINYGNGHTIAAIIDSDRRIYALMEHHTSIIKRIDFDELIKRFLRGDVTNEEIFEQGGHGAFVDTVVDVKDFVATGPNSHLSKLREANPAGDVMIVGNIGMVELLKSYEELAGV